MEYVRNLINRLLRLQNLIIEREAELKRELEEEEGSIGCLVIWREEDGRKEEVYLQLSRMRAEIVDPQPFRHKIEMSVDTFLDILGGEMTLGEAWARGLIDVEGEQAAVHAMRWSKWFERLKRRIMK